MAECPPSRPLRRLHAFALCLFACAGALCAQAPDPALTLPDRQMPALAELLDKALTQSPQMLGRNIALARAEGDRVYGGSRMLPQLYGNARYAWERVSLAGTRSSDGFGAFYNLGLSQPLFHWGERSAEREIGLLSEQIARRSYAAAYRELAASVRSQFLRLIVLKQALTLRTHEIEVCTRNLREAEGKFNAGVGSVTERGTAMIALDEANYAREREALEYEQARRQLGRLCGVGEIPDERIPSTIPQPELRDQQARLLVAYFEQTEGEARLPGVLSAKDALRQAGLRYRSASRRLLPKFDLNASTGVENQTFLTGGSVNQDATHRYSVGLVANWTLFDGFATRAAKLQSLSDRRDAELRLQTLLDSLSDDKKNAVARFELALRGLSLAEGRNGRQQAALLEAEERHKTGLSSAAQLAQVRNDCVAVELGALGARAEVYLRWGELLSLLWLDPVLERLPRSYLGHGN